MKITAIPHLVSMCAVGTNITQPDKNFENYCYTKAKETHNRHMVTPGKTYCVKPFSLLQEKPMVFQL